MKKIKLVSPALTDIQMKALHHVDDGGDIGIFNSIILDGLFRRGLIKRRAFGGIELTAMGKKVIA